MCIYRRPYSYLFLGRKIDRILLKDDYFLSSGDYLVEKNNVYLKQSF